MGWFRKNEMVVNSEKVQAIILKKKEAQATHKLTIDNKEIKTRNLIKLLGINIDTQLKFNEHTSILCCKATMQLNALSRLLVDSSILSNFNYCS